MNKLLIGSVYMANFAQTCEVSSLNVWRFVNFLLMNWYNFTDNSDDCQYVLINSCCLTTDKINSVKNSISDLLSKNNISKIIIFWCYNKFSDFLGDDRFIFIESKDIEKADNFFMNTVSIWEVVVNSLSSNLFNRYQWWINYDYWYIMISQWCSNNCSYCNIKKAKWFVKSKPINDIIKEISLNLLNWISEFMFISDDCWSYWIDAWETLLDLLKAVFSLDDSIKIKLYNIYPSFLIRYYDWIYKFVSEGKINYINIPLQSWSKRILGLMNRGYDISKLVSLIKWLKLINKDLYLYSHFITNFPWETISDLKDTLKVSKLFNEVLFLSYSDNEWTDAYMLPGKITENESKIRNSVVKAFINSWNCRWIIIYWDNTL